VTNPGFEIDVTTGWRFGTTLGATIRRDTTSAPVGNASVHITGPAASPGIAWATDYSTVNGIPVVANGEYSATFWARSQWPRTIEVVAGAVGGGASYARVVLPIDPTWRRYQVVLRPNQTATARLDLMIGEQTGDVWFDDVHFQQGTYSVYRRDFQNGTVLVNPGSTAKDVVMEGPFRRIAGLRDAAVNTGLSASTQRVGAADALFLIGTDVTPPASVRDLHPVVPGTPSTRGARPRVGR